jgi:glycosyltransferase involved in cell wall biosynthesis
MKKEIRVLVLNNYSFETVWKEVKQGLKPANHIYGIDFLEQEGMKIILVPFKKNSFLLKLSKWLERVLPIPLGDLDQQWSAWKMRKEADIVYSPCQTQTWVLSYLRALGFFKKPIVAVAHHPFDKGRLSPFRRPFLRWSFAGTDAYPALSQVVSQEINRIAQQHLSETLFWGPQLDYFSPSSQLGEKIIVAGRTGRDFTTFGKAASKTHVPCQIVCLKENYQNEFDSFATNVEVLTNDAPMTYRELEKSYQEALAIAIPFHYSKNLCGLTSLTDALAIGKPILMTRTEFIDLDLEKEGIGCWIDPMDEQGWTDAIQRLSEEEGLGQKMGKKARKIAEERFNYTVFCVAVKKIIEGVLAKER